MVVPNASESLGYTQQDKNLTGPDWSILEELANKPSNQAEREDAFYTGQFNIKNTREYFRNRYENNLEFLEQFNDNHTIELYKTLMDEFPVLRCVELKNDSDHPDNASFSPAKIDGGQYHPIIKYNFSERNKYRIKNSGELENTIPSCDSRLGRKISLKRLSLKVGADWRECAKNEFLSPDEILLHEFGHAYDFIENYIRPEYESLQNNNRGPIALYNALDKDSANRRDYKLMSPTCNEICIHRGDPTLKKYEQRLKAMGINNYDEYRIAIHQSYRDMKDETYADNFAHNFILKHYDDYFTESDNFDDKRIHIDKNKTRELDEDFVHILGIKQGLGVEINRLNGDNVSKTISGFLATNFYVGKSVYLYESGDPKNPGGKWQICSNISNIYLTPIHDESTKEIKPIVTFTDEDGTYYHINRSQKEPETITASAKEMFEDFSAIPNDVVQLIYHQTKDAREPDGNNYHARIVKAKITSHPNDDNLIMEYSGDSHSVSLYRKWKTYYCNDGGNEYEILPLPKRNNPSLFDGYYEKD